MTYRAFQLVSPKVAPWSRQVIDIGEQVRDRYGVPQELRLGLIEQESRAALVALFPDTPVVDDARPGMTGHYWFGYE